MNLQKTLKDLREQKRWTQKTMAERVCMGRSTYTKLESGRTAMTVEQLLRIAKAHGVPAYTILPEYEALVPEFEFMLLLATDALEESYTVVAYDELTPDQLAYLQTKGFGSRDRYEATPLRGRLYTFGPRQTFARLMQRYGMNMLFEHGLIQQPAWLAQWSAYQQNTFPPYEIDETDYFLVFMIDLLMPNGGERQVQAALRDFGDELEPEELLTLVVQKTGALEGDILCFSVDGYDPFSEIVR